MTAAGRTYPLERPFFVLATQNPIELEGTYPLPEAQLDRFMFNIVDDLPRPKTRRCASSRRRPASSAPSAGAGAERRRHPRDPAARAAGDRRRGSRALRGAAGRRVAPGPAERSRRSSREWVKWGAGLRASQALILAGKARALMHGRYHVSVADIQALARPVLRHRVIPNFYAESERVTADNLVERLLEAVPRAAQRNVAMPAAASTPRDLRFLDPAVIARLGTMELKARTVVEGFLSGLHRSPLQGIQRRVRRVPAVPARRRSVHARLEGLRAQRPALRQEVRGRNQPRVPPAARRERLDGVSRRARR